VISPFLRSTCERTITRDKNSMFFSGIGKMFCIVVFARHINLNSADHLNTPFRKFTRN
jgi:hypothetical protein